MRVLALLSWLFISCTSGDEPPDRTGGEADASLSGSESEAVSSEIEVFRFQLTIDIERDKFIQLGELNDECEQVSVSNFETIWEDFDEFEETCLEPDVVLVKGIGYKTNNALAVRAFSCEKQGGCANLELSEVDLRRASAPEDYLVADVFHLFDGTDPSDPDSNPYWEFLRYEWRHFGGHPVLTLEPLIDRFDHENALTDPTAYLMVCTKDRRACSSTVVLGVTPSIEGDWEVIEGPKMFAARGVWQIDREVTWPFADGGTGHGTLWHGELKIQFDEFEGPSGVEGSGSFRVFPVPNRYVMTAFYQYSQPGQGQTTGEVTLRRIQSE